MRLSRLLLLVLLFWLTGCAAVFRESRPKVRIDSDPSGAEARVRDSEPKQTPMEVEVERSGSTDVVITKPGYAEHRGVIKKRSNGGWIALDVITCVFPVLLCIPIIVDAVTGAWTDVQKEYHAKLEPASGPPPAPTVVGATPAPTTTVVTPPPNPGAGMSEPERKAAARAAYQEGVAFQEKGDCGQALPRFETAQKIGPTGAST